jgi:uncharacterized protein with GYD domain
MSTYVMLANWTDQGIRSVGDASRRIDAAKKLLADMGGHFTSLHLTMGDYDVIGIYEAPDDAIALRFILMLGKQGSVRTKSLKAFPENAFREIINSIS